LPIGPVIGIKKMMKSYKKLWFVHHSFIVMSGRLPNLTALSGVAGNFTCA
jgi:hypothetical protein